MISRTVNKTVMCSRLGREVVLKTTILVMPDGKETSPKFSNCYQALECGCGVGKGGATHYSWEDCPGMKLFK
jgi:hypothetical protein